MIYFKDVLAKYPETSTAKDAGVELVQSNLAVHYKDDAADLCAQLRPKYPGDHEVEEACKGVPVTTASRDTTAARDTTPPPLPKPPAH